MNLLVPRPCKAPGIELKGAVKEKTETLTQQCWDCVGQALQMEKPQHPGSSGYLLYAVEQ